jgi:hypothetical protein
VSTKGVTSDQPRLRAQQAGLYGILRGQIRKQQARLDRILNQRSRAGYERRKYRLASNTSQILGPGLSEAALATERRTTNTNKPNRKLNPGEGPVQITEK